MFFPGVAHPNQNFNAANQASLLFGFLEPTISRYNRWLRQLQGSTEPMSCPNFELCRDREAGCRLDWPRYTKLKRPSPRLLLKHDFRYYIDRDAVVG